MRNLFITLFLFLPFSLSARELSPLPQQSRIDSQTISLSQPVTLVGADKADADAVALLRNHLTRVQPKGGLKLIIGERGDKSVKAFAKQIPAQAEGYFLKVSPTQIVVAGSDERGTYYGVQSLLGLMQGASLPLCEITDWPSVACRGVIEGFYGNPWSHADRLRQFDFYGQNKLNIYVYGPKDDPYHRAHWRDPYPAEEAQRIRELVDAAHKNKVQFVWAIHPGGDIQWNLADSMAVVKKLEMMYDLGVRTFAVFFDDIWGEGAKGDKQAGLLNYVTDEFVRRRPGVQPLIMCPTQYNKGWSSGDYLETLGTKMYPEVRIMWTGNSVVDMIEQNDMQWINNQIKRKAFIWLNYPVNDYCQSRLLMGKTYGNGLDIADMVSGFCSNPMEYAEASKLSVYSIADYTWNMPAYDAEKSWERAAKALVPTNPVAFLFFCQDNVDLGPTGHGLRREGESKAFLESISQAKDSVRAAFGYFSIVQSFSNQLLGDSINNPHLIGEIAPWVRSWGLLAQRGAQVFYMSESLNEKDSLAFVGAYRTYAEATRAQKAITSRDFEGSIVKAKPVPSGTVIAPWIEEHVNVLVKEYQKKYAYGKEFFPVQAIADGEYFIKVNGHYLTNAQAQADRTGDRPVFVAERDVINPQRQQWLIELDTKTGRYKITNKQDGRYLNERGTFWADRQLNPYDAQWHTFLLNGQGGRFSIQCGGRAGQAFWNQQGDHLGSSPQEQQIFQLEAVK